MVNMLICWLLERAFACKLGQSSKPRDVAKCALLLTLLLIQTTDIYNKILFLYAHFFSAAIWSLRTNFVKSSKEIENGWFQVNYLVV